MLRDVISRAPRATRPFSQLAFLALAALATAPLAAQSDLVTAEVKIADGQGGFVQGGLPSYSNSRFADSAANLGDLDGDGIDDLLVGQPEPGLALPGRAYTLLMKSDGTVRAQTEITSGVGGFVGPLANTDQFGQGVAGLGDVNGDGIEDAAIGAPFHDDNGTNTGAVWVLFLDGAGGVKGEQKISNGSGSLGVTLEFGDEFGSSVEGVGDLNGDGVPDLVVGAPRDDDGGPDRGALYVLFLAADGSVSSNQKISQTAGLFLGLLDDAGRFGTSLALLGDVTGDGFVELAVGQENGLVGGVSTGSLWIVSLFTNGLVLSAVVIEDGARGFIGPSALGDHFGCSVEAIGDLNGDGVVDIAVGAELAHAPSIGFDQGVVWILALTPTLTVLTQDRIGLGEGGFGGAISNGDQFGSSVAALGDLSGDGTLELFVGVSEDDETSSRAGAAWVLSLEFCGVTGSATSRNAGTNPASYAAPAPILGTTWTGTVDVSTTGHGFAGLIAYTDAFQFPLPGGQTLLVIDATGAGELLQQPAQAGPQASFVVEVPLDTAFCGFAFSTQAVHFGGVQPFALSNAQDLVVGF